MHWPAEDGTPTEVYWQTLLDLKAEGKVRAVGLSNHKVDRLEIAERLGHVDTLQPPFSLIRRDALAAELPWCLAHGTGVIVYSPMQSGLLTGAFTEARAAALAKDDWRSRSPEFQSPRLQSNLALADALRPDRRAPRHHRRRHRRRLDARRSGRHRRHRRRAQPGAGGWLDRRGTLELTADDLRRLPAPSNAPARARDQSAQTIVGSHRQSSRVNSTDHDRVTKTVISTLSRASRSSRPSLMTSIVT